MAVQFSRQPDRRLLPGQRLKSAKLFQATFAQGRRLAGKFMVMLVKAAPLPVQIGVAAGKSLGGAVQRNRAKRRLREAFRLNRHRLQEGHHIILIARPKILAAAWDELQAELIELATKAGLLAKEQEDKP